MLNRMWVVVLFSSFLLARIGCVSSNPSKPGNIARTLQVTGTSAPQDVDRGGPVPKNSFATDVLAGLPMGRVLFACASLMKVQTSERVEVRITGDPKQDLASGLRERGVPIEASAKIAPVMKVNLTPDEDGVFDVKSLSEPEQVVGGDGYSEWVWSVTP